MPKLLRSCAAAARRLLGMPPTCRPATWTPSPTPRSPAPAAQRRLAAAQVLRPTARSTARSSLLRTNSTPRTTQTTRRRPPMARAFAERFAPGVATGKAAAPKRLVPAMKVDPCTTRAPRRGLPQAEPQSAAPRHGADTARDGRRRERARARCIEVLAAFGVKGEIREAPARPGRHALRVRAGARHQDRRA